MANNLSPELLAALQQFYTPSNSGWSPAMQSPYQADGQVYQQDGGFIYNYDPNKQQAGQDKFNVYGQDGSFSNEGTFKTDDAMQTFLMALAAAGGMQMLPGGMFGGGPGGAGYGMSGGATEPVASMGMGGGGTGAMGAGSGFETMAPLSTIDGPMSSSLLADSLAPMGGAAGSKLLGAAATAAGALSGAQGQKTSQTSERKMDPRMDPYVYGGNGQTGLLQYASQMLDKQMAPGYMQGYDDMRSKGQGLLSAPVSGNGFNRFFRG